MNSEIVKTTKTSARVPALRGGGDLGGVGGAKGKANSE